MLSNSKCLIHFYLLNLAFYPYVFNISLSSLVCAKLCKDVRNNSELKCNMYACVTAFSMEVSNGPLPFYYHHPLSAYCPSFKFFSPSPLHTPPFFCSLSLSPSHCSALDASCSEPAQTCCGSSEVPCE